MFNIQSGTLEFVNRLRLGPAFQRACALTLPLVRQRAGLRYDHVSEPYSDPLFRNSDGSYEAKEWELKVKHVRPIVRARTQASACESASINRPLQATSQQRQ